MRFLPRWLGQRAAPLSEKATPAQRRGLAGEQQAEKLLRSQGLKILVRRYQCRFGEADLVARDGDTLVFIEVKARQSNHFGDPALAVTPGKQRHISRVALDYLRRLGSPEIPVRFDIVEVVGEGAAAECHHIRDAFPLAEPYIY